MSKHATFKTTAKGKAVTAARRAARLRRQAGNALDLERLARELGAVAA